MTAIVTSIMNNAGAINYMLRASNAGRIDIGRIRKKKQSFSQKKDQHPIVLPDNEVISLQLRNLRNWRSWSSSPCGPTMDQQLVAHSRQKHFLICGGSNTKRPQRLMSPIRYCLTKIARKISGYN